LKATASADCQKAIDDFINQQKALRWLNQDKLDGWRRAPLPKGW
jgi:hypothetical protein